MFRSSQRNFSKARRKALPASWTVVQGLAMESERATALVLVADPMVRMGGIQITLVSGKVALGEVERPTQEQSWGHIYPS